MSPKYLIDTHVLLWYLAGSNEMSKPALELIEDTGNEIFISIASLWEINIKLGIGKLALHKPFEDLHKDLILYNIQIIPISWTHVVQYGNLPLHHRDPFDRMIIAQAVIEGMPVLSRDDTFSQYDVQIIW